MKQILILLSLFIFTSTLGQGPSEINILPIAYVNTDSIFKNYKYAIDSKKLIEEKYQAMKNLHAKREAEFEAEMSVFQGKIENNEFISPEYAQKEYDRLKDASLKLENDKLNLENDYINKNADYKEQITDSIKVCLVEYNKTANYQIIFNNSRIDNILLVKDEHNITKQVLNVLNDRYMKK